MKTKQLQAAWGLTCVLVLFGALLSQLDNQQSQVTASNHHVSQYAELNMIP
jgi:hypothetical protein